MKYWIAVLVVVAAALAAYALWPKEAHTTTAMANANISAVTIGTTTINVEVVDTEALRELGLSDRAALPAGHGMLFVFDAPGSWGIWMKDMQFPLDIVWAREDGTMTTIERDVATSTYPTAFYPKTPDAKYVLEINAGAAAAIAEGTKMVLQ